MLAHPATAVAAQRADRIALVLLTLRGLRPIHPPALEWFMPLALAYGAIVDGVHGVASPSGSRRPNRRGA